jgi:hypothetical protein
VTSLTLEEFQQLLPAFQEAYEQRYPTALTQTGTPRQRRPGGGAKGVLQGFEDKLLPIRSITGFWQPCQKMDMRAAREPRLVREAWL